MIFRRMDGTLIEMKKNDFTNDHLYYEQIQHNKISLFFPKESQLQEKSFNKNKNKNKSSYSLEAIAKLLS